MDTITIALIFAVPCWFMPSRFLILVTVLCVTLADTALIEHKLIMLTRFVPPCILSIRAILNLPQKRGGLGLLKPFLPFLALALISALYSLDPKATWQRAASAWFVLIGFGLGIRFQFDRTKKIFPLLRWVAVIMAAFVVYSLLATPFESSYSIGEEDIERARGLFNNPNTLGLIAMQAIFLFIYWFQNEKRKRWSFIVGSVGVLLCVALIVSGSRAAALGALLGLTVLVKGNARINKKKTRALWAGWLLLIPSFFVADYFFPEYTAGIFRTDDSRWVLWKRAWDITSDNRMLGVGFGGSDTMFEEDATNYLEKVGVYIRGSHSSFVRLLVDMGLVGTAFATLAFIVVLRRIWKLIPYFDEPKLGGILFAAVIASLVNSFFESWLFGFGSSSTIPFWLFLSILNYQADQTAFKLRKELKVTGPVRLKRMPVKIWSPSLNT